jgi:hypothetical protein
MRIGLTVAKMGLSPSSRAKGTVPFFGRRFIWKSGSLAKKWTSPPPARERLLTSPGSDWAQRERAAVELPPQR